MDGLINENPVESLAAIQNTITRTRKAVSGTYGSPLMMLWGGLLAIAYAASYFYLRYAHIIFWTMAAVGGVGSYFLWFWLLRKMPFKEPAEEKMNWRVGAMWWLLFLYVSIWLSLLAPFNGMQMNAFIVTATMFAYIMMGLWFKEMYLIWTGLFVTAMTLIGFFLLPHFYCLWMAFMAGGVIFIIGLYTKLRWK
jgi:MFS family permease